MYREISIQRLSAGSIFKLVAIGLFGTIIPFSALMGIPALFGAQTVTWNRTAITGLAGLLASPFIGAFLALLLTIFLGCSMAFGLWVYSKFRPLALLVKDPEPPGPFTALSLDPPASE